MEDPQTAFLADAPRRINNLRQDLNKLRAESADAQPELVRRIFRQLHTLKGSAAAFDFQTISRIAHELENVLEAINGENAAASINVLEEGIGEIEAAFSAAEENVSETSEANFERWRAVYQNSQTRTAENEEEIVLPFDLEKQLNSSEAKRLRQSLKRQTSLAVISAEFTAANFAQKFAALQTKLNAAGENIATLPDAEKAKDGKIALRLIFVGNETAESLDETLKNSGAEIVCFSENKIEGSAYKMPKIKLSNLWMQALRASQKTAAAQGKQVVFEARGVDEFEFEPQRAEACEIALLHIARNAVAHGIEAPQERRARGKNESGAVRLEAWSETDSFCLQISDDGRGIDSAKILRRAKERNLITENTLVDKKKACQFIFLPGFSTADAVTEDAGRGVGLDAVETAVREAGGSIEVRSATARGTTFLIRFPNKN